MGKVKITVNPEQEHKTVVQEQKLDLQSYLNLDQTDINKLLNEHLELFHKSDSKPEPLTTMNESFKCEGCKCKPDYRLRKYTAGVRKELDHKADHKSVDLLNIRLDVQKKNIQDLAQSVDALHADLNGLDTKSEVIKLEKQISKLDHHLELIEQELKVKPVSIKTERVIERFDHRLTLATILMLVINAFLVMHILSN